MSRIAGPGRVVWAVLVASAVVWGLAACSGPDEPEGATEEDVQARAEALARRVLIVDTHVDVPYRLEREMVDISQRVEGGDFDYPRAVAGGLNAPFFSIYVPASHQESGGARELADRLIDMVESIAGEHPEKFALAGSVAEVREQVAAGRVALALGMENGAPIEDDLANLRHFHERGIRYITLTHSANNAICDSSYADERTWNGLSPFGREVVAEMNRLGIMVDVSHVSDEAFDQILEVTTAPVIASHSSCRHFTPGFERNLDDERIRKLAENGGVIQINFGSGFIDAEYNRLFAEHRKVLGRMLEEHGLSWGDDEARPIIDEYRAQHPMQVADVTDVADHIDHVVRLVGVEHVGFGSDFDGVGDSLPEGLKDVSYYPNLIAELLRRGYSEQDIERICSGNLFRVWSEVERIASAP